MRRCLICHRELVDPRSIELGVGPTCRKKLSAEMIQELQEDGLDGVIIKDGIQLQLQLEMRGGANE